MLMSYQLIFQNEYNVNIFLKLLYESCISYSSFRKFPKKKEGKSQNFDYIGRNIVNANIFPNLYHKNPFVYDLKNFQKGKEEEKGGQISIILHRISIVLEGISSKFQKEAESSFFLSDRTRGNAKWKIRSALFLTGLRVRFDIFNDGRRHFLPLAKRD